MKESFFFKKKVTKQATKVKLSQKKLFTLSDVIPTGKYCNSDANDNFNAITVPNLNFGSNYYNTTSNYVQNFKRVFCFSLIHFVALITFYTPKNIRKLMAS